MPTSRAKDLSQPALPLTLLPISDPRSIEQALHPFQLDDDLPLRRSRLPVGRHYVYVCGLF